MSVQAASARQQITRQRGTREGYCPVSSQQRGRERLALVLAAAAMTAVLVLTVTPKGGLGLLTASPALAAQGEAHSAGDKTER